MPVMSGRPRPETIARNLAFKTYVDSPRPEGEEKTKLHDRFARRMEKRAALVQDGIYIPPIRESK